MAIKLIISDLDQTLLDFGELHFQALNLALKELNEQYVISYEDHLKYYDGLSTSKKLELLAQKQNFPLNQSFKINQFKQKYTIDLLKDFKNINHKIAEVVQTLKNNGYTFYVASNAVRKTIEIGLEKLNITHLVDKIYSNEDIKNPKPNPEIYLKCMVNAGVAPNETLIIEDSKHGRESAIKSGAHVCGVDNSFDFTLERISESINKAYSKSIKWAGKSDTVVLIPMAGNGSRFSEAGYRTIKPLIEVNGVPMIQKVVENLNIDANYIFIVQPQHYEDYKLKNYLNALVPGCQIVLTGKERLGAAWDTLAAKEFINNENHLVIANSDQLVEWDSCQFMHSMVSSQVDGGILTFEDNNPKWSYAKVNNGYVTQVAEKQVISNLATVGVYYFKRGADYIKYTEQMINKNIRTNNEFYVCPVFNEFIEDNKKIKTYQADKMWGLGTPQDLFYYLNNYQ